ncbi:uncharacterized protein LOC128767227 [Synchiropus splendidus]|uniref:uncharacterized protein LOC128767227 n=1 Tax=Synchiropus splendidus TaxID=270530 RepID=UPI00237D4B9F|nr:uncharacterized protein LOC128767227 [Synchiropus splendidus]
MMIRRLFILLPALVTAAAAAAVFVEQQDANLLLRQRRANSGFLEELKQGNLERECLEEICDYEEAREVFEDDAKTRQFWLTYEGKDPCQVNPCKNNGTCLNVGPSYECQCADGFEGKYCQTVFEDSLKCLYKNGQCRHFCDGSGQRRKCSCAHSYMLGEDGRDCIAEVEFPCGELPPAMDQSVIGQTRMVGANHCPEGECPWQVLIQLGGLSHCGGALIRPDWVITAAHCVQGNLPANLTVVLGEHHLDNLDSTEQYRSVSMVIIHKDYVPLTGESDIALLRLEHAATLSRYIRPVCLPTRGFAEHELLPLRYHTVSGWGKKIDAGKPEAPGAPPSSPVLRKMSVPILQNSQCSQYSGFNFTATMLCAGYLEGQQESCRGDDGSPLVSQYGSTHFLLGVVGWGQGCSQPGYYGVYNNMVHFVDWVESTMKSPPTATKSLASPWFAQPLISDSITDADRLAVPTMLLWSFLVFLLLDLTTPHVFVGNDEAHQILTRRRRANSFLEEMKQGNMERECVEERCSYEEAHEIFEDDVKTNEFWAVYYDGDACLSQPCANGGRCKDGIGSYSCYCQTGNQGYNCEIVIPELCENNNGDCQHFCNVVDENVQCSCATGYFLSSDGKTCESDEPFKCGVIHDDKTRTIFMYDRSNKTAEMNAQLNQTEFESNIPWHVTETSAPFDSSNTTREYYDIEDVIESQDASRVRIVGGDDCPPGNCPWQALILNEKHKGFCGGTILNEYIILTAAHCMDRAKYFYVKLGEFDVLVDHGHEATHQVEKIIRHNGFSTTYENDIALIKLTKPIKFSRYILPACLPEMNFAEKVLMRQPEGLVSGFGRLVEGGAPATILQRLSVPYVDRQLCLESTNLRIYSSMFCAGYDKIRKDACQGDSGGPHVTQYRGTYFVTGVVSWGEGCARAGKYGVYTQVSKYLEWIRKGMERLMSNPAITNPRNKRQPKKIKRMVQ